MTCQTSPTLPKPKGAAEVHRRLWGVRCLNVGNSSIRKQINHRNLIVFTFLIQKNRGRATEKRGWLWGQASMKTDVDWSFHFWKLPYCFAVDRLRGIFLSIIRLHFLKTQREIWRWPGSRLLGGDLGFFPKNKTFLSSKMRAPQPDF